jgi:hypothetical protein
MEDAPQPKILPRDKLLRDTFTPAEAILFGTILITTSVVFWAAEPRSFWILGFFLIAGCLCPLILKTHEHSHPFFIDYLWMKFWLLSAPIWLIILQFVAGSLQNPLVKTDIDGSLYLTITRINQWLPVTTFTPTTWITVLGFCSIYLVAVNLFIVPKSRSFFERTMPWLCLSAVLVGIFGYCQKALDLEYPIFTNGTGKSDFFAFFPYDGHWAAFATLWSTACVAMALLSTRYDDSDQFIRTIGPWYLTGGILLGASGFLVQARWPAAILLLTFSILLLIFSANFLTSAKDKNRNSIALSSGLIGTAIFASAIFRIFQVNEQAETADILQHAATEMFLDSPIFGWGMDSFAQLAPFYADDRLLGARYDRAASDVLQFLAEFGIVGCTLPLVGLIYLLIRYVKGKHTIRLTNHLLIGCAGVITLAFVDSPFMSPAVFLSFHIILFSSLRWADLSRNKVDEVDARPALVVDESHRTVPFFTDEYKEKEK